MPRGGRRAGTPGKAYGSNRSDLNVSRTLPVQAVQGGQYGSGAASVAAQQAVPMGTTPGISAPQQMPAASQPYAGRQPGQAGDPLRPTERPDEHPMTGAPIGPGAGPEALALPPAAPTPLLDAVANLNSLGDQASPLIKAIRVQAQRIASA